MWRYPLRFSTLVDCAASIGRLGVNFHWVIDRGVIGITTMEFIVYMRYFDFYIRGAVIDVTSTMPSIIAQSACAQVECTTWFTRNKWQQFTSTRYDLPVGYSLSLLSLGLSRSVAFFQSSAPPSTTTNELPMLQINHH
jgi:hypothetical protein